MTRSRKINRSYKKGAPFRDLRKFIIVAEGEREDDYFSYFKGLSRRVDITLVEREKGKSAVSHLAKRLQNYDYNFGIEKEDIVWFVLDVDRWPRKQIEELYQMYINLQNHHLAISNSCFEVWLHYHVIEEIPTELDTPKKLKYNLNQIIKGGYNRNQFILMIELASERAAKKDINPEHYYPDIHVTKIYKLAQQLLSFLGKNWKKP